MCELKNKLTNLIYQILLEMMRWQNSNIVLFKKDFKMNISQKFFTTAILATSGIAFAETNMMYDEQVYQAESTVHEEESMDYAPESSYEAPAVETEAKPKKMKRYVYVKEEKEEEEEEDEFHPFWEINVMGGIAALDAEDGSVDILGANGEVVETDKFTPTDENDWDWGTARIGLGYVFAITDELDDDELIWFPLLTPQLNLYYLRGDVDGEIYRYEDANFNDQSFDMDFSSTRLMFDLGLTIASYEQLSLYGLAGIGISWNKVDMDTEFHDASCDDCIVGLPNSDENSTGFAYEIGAGLSYAVMDNLSVALEYLFTGFNDVELGDNNEPFNTESSDMDIHAQSLLLGIRIAL